MPAFAHFARVATLARTALAYRRGFLWASDEGWEDIFRSIEAMETQDVALRAKLAAKRREYAQIKRERDANDFGR